MVKQTFLMPCFKMTKEFSHLQATTLQMFILSQWVENAFFRNQSGNTRRGLIIRRSTHTGLKMAEPRGRGCQKKISTSVSSRGEKTKSVSWKGQESLVVYRRSQPSRSYGIFPCRSHDDLGIVRAALDVDEPSREYVEWHIFHVVSCTQTTGNYELKL